MGFFKPNIGWARWPPPSMYSYIVLIYLYSFDFKTMAGALYIKILFFKRAKQRARDSTLGLPYASPAP